MSSERGASGRLVSFEDPPARRLDRRALALWRAVGTLWAVGAAFAAAVGGAALAGAGAPAALAALAPVAAIALGAAAVALVPPLAYARWRYDIDDEQIDLQRGWVWLERTLVPMARVQHVETEHGPLQRRLGLATVRVHTAAGAFEIPALDEGEAARLRARIAELARVSDEV